MSQLQLCLYFVTKKPKRTKSCISYPTLDTKNATSQLQGHQGDDVTNVEPSLALGIGRQSFGVLQPRALAFDQIKILWTIVYNKKRKKKKI